MPLSLIIKCSSVRSIGLVAVLFSCMLPSVAWAQIETKAQYAYIIDHATGTELLNKNADVQMGPSSMTKLMTLYILFSQLQEGRISLDTKWPISETAWRKGGSKMYVKEGDKVTVEELIKGIVVASGNDACIVVAEALAGSEEAFAEEMNIIGKEIGLTGSNFRNATGWPDDEHVMTARDLVTLAVRLYEDFPDYYHYFNEESFAYNKIKQNNRNKLIFKDIGVDGLKTGFTNKAGYGIVVSAQRDGRRVFMAINGLTSVKERLQEAERLVLRSFSDYKKLTLYTPHEDVLSVPIWGGLDDEVMLTSKEEVSIIVQNRLSRREKVTLSVNYQHPVFPTHPKGAEIGELAVNIGDHQTKRFPLITATDVPPKEFLGSAMEKLKFVLMGYEGQKP